jgi:hypothetical protein
MAGIKDALQGILTALQALPDFQHVRIWNNQFKCMESGKMESFPLPCAFVEVVAPEELTTIGVGVVAGDLKIRIHVGHEFYDAGDGTMAQDLDIFDLKEKIVRALSGATFPGCSAFQRISESQNFDHDNVYYYILEFVTHFIDSKGSKYDADVNTDILSTPAIDIQVNATEVDFLTDIDNIPTRDYNI